jgi:hypothetical protein
MVTTIMCNIFSTCHQHFLFLKKEFSDGTLTQRGSKTHPLPNMSIGQNKSLENR